MPENVYDKYLKHLEALAKDDFKNHQLRKSSDGRWVIQKRNEKHGHWEGFYWTEIINLDGAGLLVHGDISPCLFKYYSGDKHVTSRVRWIANSGIDYIEQKFSIGMDDQDVCRTFDSDVAIWEIEGHIRDRVHDICEEMDYETPDIEVGRYELKFTITEDLRDWDAENNEDDVLRSDIEADEEIEALLNARRRATNGDAWQSIQYDLYEDLCKAGDTDCGEYVFKIGIVPDARLFYAREACRKLVELLDEKEKENVKENQDR